MEEKEKGEIGKMSKKDEDIIKVAHYFHTRTY